MIIFAALCRTGPTLLPPVLEKEPVLPVPPPAPWASINAIRALAMDAVEAANSGHPGTPMALAPAAYVLWTRYLRHHPASPYWADRDRFVLSCGHASMLLYALLHLSGYDLPLEEIKRFRQWGSHTPGHPERGHTPGIETTTGPLGQGVGNAVGMAMAERFLAQHFNRPEATIVDHRTWAFVSDGDLMEGIASEASSVAGHLRLGKLTLIYDDNHITIDGRTDLAFSEDVGRRYESYGWRVLRVDDGNDLTAIDRALADAASQSERPTLIILRTIIADPAPTKRDTSAAHGAALGAEEVKRTKALLGWPDEPFYVPPAAYDDMRQCVNRGAQAEAEWTRRFEAYAKRHAELATEFRTWMAGALPQGWEAALPTFAPDKAGVATRVASHKTLISISSHIANLVGGSADLAESTGVVRKEGGAFAPALAGTTVHWGIREHGMGAALNGMAAHGGVRPFGSTFLVFTDYMKPSIRLAALMRLPVIYVGTHDSIGLGEDGPTHQPIEHLAMLRAIPNLVTLRPADANETAEAWRVALERTDGPTLMALTRQKVPTLDRAALGAASGVRRGAYILYEPEGGCDAILIATGSEVSLALEAVPLLDAEGIRARVVSMPSWELFNAQSMDYRDEVLPPSVRARVAIEAASPFGWERWVGERGGVLAMHGFGASAPGNVLFREFGFTPANVAALVRQVFAGASA